MILTLNLIIQALFTSFCMIHKPANIFLPMAVVLMFISYYLYGDMYYD